MEMVLWHPMDLCLLLIVQSTGLIQAVAIRVVNGATVSVHHVYMQTHRLWITHFRFVQVGRISSSHRISGTIYNPEVPLSSRVTSFCVNDEGTEMTGIMDHREIFTTSHPWSINPVSWYLHNVHLCLTIFSQGVHQWPSHVIPFSFQTSFESKNFFGYLEDGVALMVFPRAIM